MPEEKITSDDRGKELHAWDFPEFIKYTFTKRWLMIMAVLGVAVLTYAILNKIYLLIIIEILLLVIYLTRARRNPATINIKIMEDGVTLSNNKFYPWSDLKNFWIIYEPPEVKNLYLEFKTGIRPTLTIPLETQNPLSIRKTLLEYLPEDMEKENEPFSDGLSRTMKL